MSSSAQPKSSIRVKLSNFGHAVAGRRMRNPTVPRRNSTLPSLRTSTNRDSSTTRSPVRLNSLPSPPPSLRQLVQETVASRSAFETNFHVVTDHVLNGNSDVARTVVDEIFEELRSAVISFSSKSLSLELLDSILILDARCLDAIATNPSLLQLIVDLAVVAKASDVRLKLPVAVNPGTSDSEIQMLTDTAERILLHWESFVSESGNQLSSKAVALLDAAGSMRHGSSIWDTQNTHLRDPLAGRVSQQAPKDDSFLIQCNSVPVVSAQQTRRWHSRRSELPSSPSHFPSPSSSSLQDKQQGSFPVPLPMFGADCMLDIPNVEEQLAQTFSVIELTQETIRQAEGLEAKGMVEDLLRQCEKEKKALSETASRAASSSDYVLVDQVQKVESDLKATIDSANAWIVKTMTQSASSSSPPPPPPARPASAPLSLVRLPSRQESHSPRETMSTSRKAKKRRSTSLTGRGDREPDRKPVFTDPHSTVPRKLSTPSHSFHSVADDFAFSHPFSSTPAVPSLPSSWPVSDPVPPTTPLAPVSTGDAFFSAGAWPVDFPVSSDPLPSPPNHTNDFFQDRTTTAQPLQQLQNSNSMTEGFALFPFDIPVAPPSFEASPSAGRSSRVPVSTFDEQEEVNGEKKRQNKSRNEKEGRKEQQSRSPRVTDLSFEDRERRSSKKSPQAVQFLDLSPQQPQQPQQQPFMESTATINRLKNIIKGLETRLDTIESEIRIRVEMEMRSRLTVEFNEQLSRVQCAYDATKRELGDLHKELTEKEEHIAKLKDENKKKDSEIDKLKFHLADREKGVHHAKEMWMRENSRACQVSDELDELEKKFLDKEKQLILLSKQYQDMSRETAALKNLVKADVENLDFPYQGRKALFQSVPLGGRSSVGLTEAPLTPHSLPCLRSHVVGTEPPTAATDDQDASPVQFYSMDSVPVHSTQSRLTQSGRSRREARQLQSRADGECMGKSLRSAVQQEQKHDAAFGATVDWQFTPDVSASILLEGLEQETFERYRALLLANDEVLYEDQTVQIGMKASYKKGLTGSINLYYGNLTPADLQCVSVSIQLPQGLESLAITHSQLPSVLNSREQLCQSLIVSCFDPFEGCPLLRLQYLLPDNSPAQLQLSLPITISKFIEGRQLEYDEFFRFWKHEEFILKEVTALIHVDRQRYRSHSLLPIAKAMQLNNALALLPGVDPSERHLICAGIFPPSNADIGIPTSLILVRYEAGSGKYRDVARLSIRSDSIVLARGLRRILTTVLGIPTRKC